MDSQAKCSSCRAKIIWAVMKSGKKNPIDAEPTETGNVRLTEVFDEAGQTVVSGAVLTKDELAAAHDGGELLHLSHFATCPASATFRKKK